MQHVKHPRLSLEDKTRRTGRPAPANEANEPRRRGRRCHPQGAPKPVRKRARATRNARHATPATAHRHHARMHPPARSQVSRV